MTDLQAWQAGPFNAWLDPATGGLRDLRVGDTEVLRGIYAAVRDADWGTVAPRIGDWQVDGHRVAFVAECCAGPIDFVWHGLIEVVGNQLHYTMDGQARTGFRRNRIGFCVLHPMEVAGLPCRIEHVDATVSHGAFPAAVSPHQPFADIRAVRHEPAPGLAVEVRFEGETFEMEDQRNWTDASFKTYCTPLGLPFPVRVEAGERVRQTVTVSIEGRPPIAVAAPPRAETTIHVDETSHPLPAIGLGYHPDADEETLQRLAPAHLRVDLRTAEPGWRQTLTTADALGYPLELAITDDPLVAPELPSLQSPIARILLFDGDRRATRQHNLDRWLPVLRSLGAPLAGGTDAWFAELNRERPPLAELDRLTFSITPQVHAFDEASLVETLAAQEVVVRDAQAIGGGRPVGVSTVTLLPRFNPNATTSGSQAQGIDPRQGTDFCAAWTVGSLHALARAGADSVTYYETSVPRGVWGFPVGDVFAAIAGATTMYETTSESPRVATTLVVDGAGGKLALVANLTPEPRVVRLEPVGIVVELGPYEVAKLALGST